MARTSEALSRAIGYRLVLLCDERGITINRLATLAGLTQSTVDSIVKGKSRNPSIITMKRVCDALGVTVDQFLDYPPIQAAFAAADTHERRDGRP